MDLVKNKIGGIVIAIKQNKLLAAAVIAYFVIFTALSVLKHESFHSTAFDLAVFDQNVWMMSQGRMGINTVNGFIGLADHVQPILFIPVMLYKLFPTPIVLIVLQVLMISIGAIPLYFIARKKLGHTVAMLFVLAYFLYPSIQHQTLFDFHTESFLIPFLMWAIYFLIEKSMKGVFISLFLAGLTKEYIPLVFIFFAAYILIFYRKPKAAAALSILAIVWLWLNYGIIINSYEFTPLHIYSGYYGGNVTLLGKIFAAIAGLFTIDKIGYVALMLIPLAGLSILGPEFFALSAPGFALVLLRANVKYSAVTYHHTAFMLPFLFAAAVIGFERAARILGKGRRKFVAVALIIAAVAAFLVYGPFTVRYNAETFDAWGEHAKAGREMLAMIPDDAAVSATSLAVPHLSRRDSIYMFPAPYTFSVPPEYYWELPEKQMAQWFNTFPDFVVLDTSRKDVMLSDQVIRRQSCLVAGSGNYSLAYDSEGWVLLQKTATAANSSIAEATKRLCGG